MQPEGIFWSSVPLSDAETGIWRYCFWIVDSAGNESNEFCEHILINETAGPEANLNKSLPPEGVFDFSNITIEGEAVE